jgi:type III secretion protein C
LAAMRDIDTKNDDKGGVNGHPSLPQSSPTAWFFKTITARALGLCLGLCLFTGAAVAEEVPWRQRAFDLQATNEPLSSFLLRLLTFDGISATMSPSVGTGRVNGRFKGKSERIFKELADTYGLTYYFDGATLHVYSMSEIETRLLQVEPGDVPRVERTLRQMRLADARFPLRVASGEGQVLVSGPPRYVDLVEQVVGRVADTPTRPKSGVEIRVFKLKHARAGDTVVSIGGIETRISGVASTLNSLLSETASSPRAQDYGPRSLSRSLQGLRGQGLAAVGRNTANTGSGAANPPGGLAGANPQNANAAAAALMGSGNQPSSPSSPGGAQAAGTGGPPGLLPRDSVVRADERLNAVIVRDTTERMAMYAPLIAALDVQIGLVEIEATVLDVSEEKSESLGIDWRLHGRKYDVSSSPNSLAGNGTGVARNKANDLLYTGNPLSVGGGLVSTLLFGNERNYLFSRINLLAENGDAKLVSRPRVLTLENSEAVLQSTSDFYVRVAGREATDLYNVSLGMTMRVTPTLVEDEQGRRFKLIIRIEDGNTNSGQQVDQIPVVNRSTISTQAVVGEGQSLLIGGLVTEERGNTRSGVPGVSDVPFLGWLFGQRGKSMKRNERMFMITPRLVDLNAPQANVPADMLRPVPGGPSGTEPTRTDSQSTMPKPYVFPQP